MFFSSPSGDMQEMLIFLGIGFVLSVLWGGARLSWWAFFMTLSLLWNGVVLLALGSFLFDVYDIVWLKYFAVFVWPILNILLIIAFFLHRKYKQ